MPNISPVEIFIVLIIALLVFGPRKLPEMGRSLGKGIREFKQSVMGEDDHDDRDDRSTVTRTQELPPAAPPPPPAPTTPTGAANSTGTPR